MVMLADCHDLVMPVANMLAVALEALLHSTSFCVRDAPSTKPSTVQALEAEAQALCILTEDFGKVYEAFVAKHTADI
jgi:hypothetical protein